MGRSAAFGQASVGFAEAHGDELGDELKDGWVTDGREHFEDL